MIANHAIDCLAHTNNKAMGYHEISPVQQDKEKTSLNPYGRVGRETRVCVQTTLRWLSAAALMESCQLVLELRFKLSHCVSYSPSHSFIHSNISYISYRFLLGLILPYPQLLEQCLTQKRLLIDICLMNEGWMDR